MEGRRLGMSRGVCWGVIALTAIGMGCQSDYRAGAIQIDRSLLAGDVKGAGDVAYALFKGEGNERDRVVRALDAGPVLMLSGRPAESTEALESAFELVRPYLDTKADVSVSENTESVAVNQTLATYTATPIERILLNTFLAINRMCMGDAAAARVELNRAEDWQKDAEAKYSAAIDRERQVAEKKSSSAGFNLDKAKEDPRLAQLTEGLGDAPGYGTFQSPFTSYLRAAFLSATSREIGDVSNARSEWRKVWEMVPESRPVVESDLARLESASEEPVTWVFFMSGLSPRREELRLDIPIPFGKVNYVSAAFPRMRPVDAFTTGFTLTTADGSTSPVLLMDVQRSVAAEFQQVLPAIIAQELISSALKTAATYAAREATKKDDWAYVIATIGGIAYQAASTAADIRVWRTLPRVIYVARVPTPGDGVLKISAAGGPSATVSVAAGKFNGVVVWHTQPTAPTIASTTWSMSP